MHMEEPTLGSIRKTKPRGGHHKTLGVENGLDFGEFFCACFHSKLFKDVFIRNVGRELSVLPIVFL